MLQFIKRTTRVWAASLMAVCVQAQNEEKPNILWLVSEDNSPLLGCYGDTFATTPNIDKLASEGFLYTHAYANVPVCAPARNTIISGVYANSNGNQHMRSYYPTSEQVRFYPEFLKEQGYYCSNNFKTDYNTASAVGKELWDESSREAHYRNRKEGQPFFAVFNSGISHESSIFKRRPDSVLRHDPQKVPLAPYHPDTKEMRHDWAQYYDNVEDMDAWVGEKLRELEEAGLADNTIVFYYSDHGGVLARSKRYVYETGTRVPLVVRIPKKYKHLFPAKEVGSTIDRLVSFVDFAPTVLSLIGANVPGVMQGNAFLGAQATAPPEYVFMLRGRMDGKYDMSRAVRSKKFRYIRNYMPHRIYGQHLEYLLTAASIRSWEEACLQRDCNGVQSVFWKEKPMEELYDTENDPWEVKNLANDPKYVKVLLQMRNANKAWITQIRDTGFIPEADLIDRTKSTTMYDYMRLNEVPFNQIVHAAEIASQGKKENSAALQEFLGDADSAIRYWGATGLLILKEKAKSALPKLKKATGDSSANVACVAAETLYHLGEKQLAVATLTRIMKSPNPFARLHALNVMSALDDPNPLLVNAVKANFHNPGGKYDKRNSKSLLIRWGMADVLETQ
ncbi:MAG: sulfatase-like hydrolase/transferase [Bacteroidota bacterium]